MLISEKLVLYQVLPRLFGNLNTVQKFAGTIHENGVGKLNHFTEKALSEINNLGITHIWYTGILQHATCTDYSKYGIFPDLPEIVKGRAGSPYAVKDYYDIDPDLADNVEERMLEFDGLVQRTHQVGLKVLIDFVPNHVARTYYSDNKPKGVVDFGDGDDTTGAFSNQNNFYYLRERFSIPEGVRPFGENVTVHTFQYKENPAKATGNDCFSAQPSVHDWYETVKLNYGVDYQNARTSCFDPIPDTWTKMRDILSFWTRKEIDGFRCDMAEMVPVAFWNWVIPQIRALNPEILFIAEIYNPAQYRNYIFEGKFDYLYDKVGLYDTLRSIITTGQSTHNITACWQQTEGIANHMLCFMENHDEQRFASRFFAGDARKAFPAMLVSAAFRGGPVMLYAGQEVGETAEGATGFSGDDGRTSIFDYTTMPEFQKWVNDYKFDGAKLSVEQKKLREKYRRLLQAAKLSESISHGAFYDLMWANDAQDQVDIHRIYLFLRYTDDEKILCIAYFGDVNAVLKLQIPEHAYTAMKMNINDAGFAENVLCDSDKIKINKGCAEISLTPYDYKMYKLKSFLC